MIHNIHILINPDATPNPATQTQEALQAVLIASHRRGEHPWGSMRRECPLCQLNK